MTSRHHSNKVYFPDIHIAGQGGFVSVKDILNEIIERLDKIEKRIDEIVEEIDDLKYAPSSGIEYQKAKEHFEENQKQLLS